MKRIALLLVASFTLVGIRAESDSSSLSDGTYYRILNVMYDECITESNNFLRCFAEDATNYAQYWQLIKDGEAWQLKNVLTDNYVQQQTVLSSQYKTAAEPATFTIEVTDDETENSWLIYNEGNQSRALRCNSSSNVVSWNTNSQDSHWQLIETELTEEEIASAKEDYRDYADVVDNLTAVQEALDNLFEDKACTILRPEIASLTDDELDNDSYYASLPTVIKKMVLKVKNDTWSLPADSSDVAESYEKFFRIADYQPYSNYSQMATLMVQSYSFGKLSSPTGIYLNSSDVLYIYVDESPDAECSLQVELVTTDGEPGSHQTGTTTSLKAGLNVVEAAHAQDLVYIFYQINNTSSYLADYPDIKIHIEGGNINGYWDATRGMTNQDWANMKELGMLSQTPIINLKTEHLVFVMNSELVLEAVNYAHLSNKDSMEDIEKLMRIWNMMCANEESYMGLEEFDGRYRNIWNVFSVSHNYMYTTTYGTYYTESTLSQIMNYYDLTHMNEGNDGTPLWGPSHEIGHSHQKAIKVIGSTESSNNLFSNINLFEQGVSTTRYSSPVLNFDTYLAYGLSWIDHPIEVTTRMFFQLYLYYHVMGHDTEFLPKLFKALRDDPLDKGTWNSSLEIDTDDDGVADSKGAYVADGKKDYLHFAKKVCDVAQADLSEFFEAYGMFVPIEDKYIYDYNGYFVTTKQEDIDEAREYMRQYEKKLGNIMFIDDHIEKKLADPDNKFEAVPATDGYKVNCNTYDGSKVGTAGNYGDFEQYDGHTEYDVDDDYYTLNGYIISFKGNGCVGHKVYDLDGNLIWACNMMNATVPSHLLKLFPDDVVVVAAEQNMKDVPCPYYKANGSSPVYKMQVSFPDGNSKLWWASDNIDAYLPANAIAVLGSSNAPEALTSSVNVVDVDSTAQRIVIDGDMECHIPQDINAASLTFTKSGEGYQALSLPFPVENGTTVKYDAFVPEDTVAAGDPVVVEGDITYNLSDICLSQGDYTTAENGNILSSDGVAVVQSDEITPFVYLFDNTFEIGEYDAINEMLSAPNADECAVYDLNGRRITKVTKPGVYIVNGVKMFVK